MENKVKRLIGTRTSILLSSGIILGVVIFTCVVVMLREVPVIERSLLSSELYYELENAISNGPRADGERTGFANPDQKFFTDDPRFPEQISGIPGRYNGFESGYSEYEGTENSYYVYIIDKNDHRYVIQSDQTEFEEMEKAYGITVIGIAALMYVLSLSLIAWRVTAALRPARLAANAISRFIEKGGSGSLKVKVPDDEIGYLALTCDRACRHVFRLLEKERFFSSDLSHELRTRIAEISSGCELLKEGDLTLAQKNKLESIQTACERITSLVKVLLALARDGGRESADDEMVTLREVALRVIESEKAKAEARDLALELKGEGKDEAYPFSLLFTVMDNLVSNALRYTEKGGVTIEISGRGFSVKDSGRGMSDEEQARVFEPFYRGKTSQGHGIGLSLVKRICDDGGWEIFLESNSGKGSRFTVTLGKEL